MKQTRAILFFVLLALSPLENFSQTPHPILRSFSGQINGSTIRLSWVIRGGNTCEGTRIQRSTDGAFFETIGEIGGVCGSPDFDVPYLFVDSLPVPNQTNYYRLELGTQGFSTPVIFRFVPLNDQGYNLVYDPSSKTAVVYFDNPQSEPVDFQLISLNGIVLSSGNTRDSALSFNFSGSPSGIYIVLIQAANRSFKVRIPIF